jgi:hypothetical protein
MAKKISANLNTVGSSCYAILVPGVGYLKHVWGDIQFEPKLPKLSGCFNTYREALDGIAAAEQTAQGYVQKAMAALPHCERSYFDKFFKETNDNLKNAIVVEINVSLAEVK